MRKDIYNGMEIEWLREDKKELEIFFFNLFIYGCVGSSFLCEDFL